MSLTKVMKKVLSVTVICAFMMQQTGFVFAADVDNWADLKAYIETSPASYNVTTNLTAADSPNGTISVTANGNAITGGSLTQNGTKDPLFNVSSSVTSFSVDNYLTGSIVNQGTMTYTGSTLREGSVTGAGTFIFGNITENNNTINQTAVQATAAADVTNNAAITATTFTNNGTFDNNDAITATTITNTGTLSSTADNLIGAVTNNNALTLEGGAVQAAIGGTGNTTVTADLTSDYAIAQTGVSVNSGVTFNNNAAITATTIANAGTLNSTANNLIGVVANNGELNLAGGGTQDDITGTGTTNITADLTNQHAITQANLNITNATVKNYGLLTAATSVDAGSTLKTDPDNLAKDVNNAGIVEFNTDGTLAVAITGADGLTKISASGEVVVDDTNGSITQDTVKVGTNATLTANADNITTYNEVFNDGIFNIIGGTNYNEINGDGSTVFSNNVTNNADITQDSIVNTNGTLTNSGYLLAAVTNQASATLLTDPDDLGEDVLNAGQLTFTEKGTLSVDVTGTGVTDIQKDLTNEGYIEQKNINVASGAVVTTNADDLKATDTTNGIVNAGTINYTGGTTGNTITGAGRVDITGYVTNTGDITQTTVSNSGVFTNEGDVVAKNFKNTNEITGTGTLTTTGTGISSNTGTIAQAALTNNGTFDNAGHIALTGALTNTGTFNTNADLLTAAGDVSNVGDFNITGGTNTNVITGAGTTNFTGDATNKAAITQTTVTNSAKLTNNALITADVTNSGTLTTDGANISGDIANTGSYVITNGNNANTITGAGTTTIQGTTTNNGSITQDKVIVANAGSFTTDIDDVSAAIANEGTMTWNGGTANHNVVTGNGELTITGSGTDVLNTAAISQDAITIIGSASLTTDAGLLTAANGIANYSDLSFLSGTNNNEIFGTGDLSILGNVTNQAAIEQDTISVDLGKLTTNANLLVATSGITNDSEISFTGGDNINAISGNGTTYIDGTVQNLADIYTKMQVNTGAHYGTATDVHAKIDNRGTTDLIDADILAGGKISGTGVTNILGDTVNNGSITQSGVVIAAGASLNTNSQDVNAAVTNDGDLIWNGGAINKNVINGTGALEIANGNIANTATITQGSLSITGGSLTSDADLLAFTGGIDNATYLTLTNGTNTNVITSSAGTGAMTITGEVINTALIDQDVLTVTSTADFTNNNAHILADVMNNGVFTNSNGLITGNVTNVANAAFVTDGTGVDGNISNDGDYYITTGDNDNKITGTGALYIQGATTNTETVTQKTMTIADGASFVATDITDVNTSNGISNAGVLEMVAGTNANQISGTTGTLNITGDVTHASGKTINQDTINIATLGKFTVKDVDDVTTVDGIESTGTLVLEGTGTNKNNISGTGVVETAGTITNQGNIDQKSLSNTGSFTSNADLLAFANGITNTNELNVTGGTNANEIAGTGTTNFTNDVVNNAAINQATVTNDAGTLDNNAAITATFINQTGTVNNEAVITGSITNTNGTVNSTADNLNGVVTNNGILNVAGGTVQGTISGSGDMNITDNLVNAQNINQDTVYNEGNMTNSGAITVATSFTNNGVLDNTAAITGAIINGGTVNSTATNLVGTISNTGTLNLEGGVTQGAISGAGDTNITADLTNNVAINQTNVSNTAALTNNATITATDIANSGTITGKASDLVASNEIANDGSLVFNAASTGASKITGAGDVQVAANTTLTGTNTYAGGTLIDGATLTVAGASNIGTGDVTFASSGILDVTATGSLDHNLVGQTATDDVTVQNAAALTLNGDINGADFHKVGTGDMTLAMDSNNYTGDTYVDGGKLIGNTGNINNIVYGAAGTTVEFNDTTDADLNEINTLGTFVQSGSAKLNVQNNAFTANTVNVNAGTFAANRALTANTMNIASAAKLQGNGTITGNVNVDGTLAPGNSIDTLTINGDLNLNSGSTTAIEITDTPASDKVSVTGATTINSGANLTVSNISGRYFEWESFDILESAGNVTGTFTYDGSVSDYDTSRIQVSADYSDPTKVTLTAKRKATDYTGTHDGLSHNQREVTQAMDAVSTGFGGDITNALLQLEQLGGLNPTDVTLINPNSTFESALNDLHGVLYANSAMLPLFNAKTAHVYDRIAKRNPATGECPTCHDNVWVAYYNQYDKAYATSNSPRFTNTMSGLMAGYDRSSDEFLLGVYGGYGESSLRQRSDKMDIEDGTLGIYSGYMNGDFLLKGTLSTSRQNYYGKRHIEFMGRSATAKYEGWGLAMDVEGSYNVAVFNWLNVKPFVGVLGSYAHQQAFTEKGADSLNLHVENHNQLNVQGRLGFQLDGKIKNKLSWYGSVAVKQYFGDDYAKLHMSLGLPGTRMDIKSAELGGTSISGQFGLNYAITDSFSLYGNLDAGTSNKAANCYGNIGVAYTW